MKTKRSILRAFICFMFLTSRTLPQGRPASLSIKEAIGALSFAPPLSLSPTADWVAYSVANGLKREPPKDPRYLYYTPTGAVQESVGSDLWITSIGTRQTQNLTRGIGTNWGPVWSPDGSHLAFYSDRSGVAHLWVWDKTTGKMRQLSDAIVRPFFNFQVVRWTPDSRQILVKVLPENMNLEQAFDFAAGPSSRTSEKSNSSPTRTVYSFFPTTENAPAVMEVPEWSKWYFGDLALVDVRSGHVRRIARGTNALGNWISPDGKFVAYTSYKGRKTNTQRQLYDLFLISLADCSSRLLAADIDQGYGIWVSWSPDSRTLAYLGSTGGVSGSDCFVVSISGGSPRNVAPSTHPPFGYSYRAPLWDSAGKCLYFISSGVPAIGQMATSDLWRASVADATLSRVATVPNRSIVEVVSPLAGGRFWTPGPRNTMTVRTRDEETKQAGFYRIDLETGAVTKLIENNSYIGSDSILLTDVSSDSQTLLFVFEDSTHPMEIWTSGPSLQDARYLTSINPNLTDHAFGRSRLVSWTSMDGEQLYGALLLPSAYKEGTRYPLIVNVYGGSYASDDVNRFGLSDNGGDDMQILATRGYAVLLPDAPTGRSAPMADIAKAVLPAVERVVEMGIADTNRVGVMGASYGGYSVLALIVQSTRFKAAVAGAAAADLVSNYGTMDDKGTNQTIGWSENGQGKMLGTPWQVRDRYIENSPLFYLDRIQTPLLLVHGELDRTVSPRQAEEVFVGLRRLRKEVTYVKYAGEDHWPGTWSPVNVIDYWTRVVQWFDMHLRPEDGKK